MYPYFHTVYVKNNFKKYYEGEGMNPRFPRFSSGLGTNYFLYDYIATTLFIFTKINIKLQSLPSIICDDVCAVCTYKVILYKTL